MHSPEVQLLFETAQEIMSLSPPRRLVPLSQADTRRIISPLPLGKDLEYFALNTRRSSVKTAGFDINVIILEVHEQEDATAGKEVEELEVEIPVAFSGSFSPGELFIPQLLQWRDFCRDQHESEPAAG